jgi:hypothetical protein
VCWAYLYTLLLLLLPLLLLLLLLPEAKLDTRSNPGPHL